MPTLKKTSANMGPTATLNCTAMSARVQHRAAASPTRSSHLADKHPAVPWIPRGRPVAQNATRKCTQRIGTQEQRIQQACTVQLFAACRP